jgi:hypothetical protein
MHILCININIYLFIHIYTYKCIFKGSCDNCTRVWRHLEQGGWSEEAMKGPGHTGMNIYTQQYGISNEHKNL